MSSDVLPPNPCLLAILLVAKVNSEPQIVFHYPPRPGQDNTHFTRYLAAQDKEQDGSSSSDDDSSSSHDEDVTTNDKPKDTKTGDNTPELDVEEPGSVSPEKNDIWKSQFYEKPRWNDLFGLGSYGLSRLLCPPSTAHKQRFEISIDDKVFIGRPIFAREGEHWRKRKTEKKSKLRASVNDSSIVEELSKGKAVEQPAQEAEDSTDAPEHDSDNQDDLQSQEQSLPDENGDPPLKPVEEPPVDHDRQKPARKDILNMFHVVFVLNPPPLEHHLRVKEMYDHVVKKFSKALRWEQARSNLVLREVIALLKDAPFMKRAQGNFDLSV